MPPPPDKAGIVEASSSARAMAIPANKPGQSAGGNATQRRPGSRLSH